MARRRRKRRGKKFGPFLRVLSMLVICAVFVVALTLFFRVETVEVTGAERYSKQEVTEAAGVQPGDNLFLLNKFSVDTNIRTQLPYVENIHIRRKLPDTLVIEVEECRQPLALAGEDSVWLVSPRGLLVEQLPSEAAKDLPQIDGCTLVEPAVGSTIRLDEPHALQQSSLLELLKALEEAQMMEQVDAIHLADSSTLSLDFAERFHVELPYSADYGYKLRFLDAIVNEGVESNQTGTIQLNRTDGEVHFIES